MKFATKLIIPLLLIIGWEITARSINNAALIPKLWEVTRVLLHPTQELLGTSGWGYHLWVSLLRVFLGYFAAIVIAVPLGILMGRSPRAEKLFSGSINFFHPLSPIMWIPFAMILFKGYAVGDIFNLSRTASALNDLSFGMLFVIAYGSFFPIFMNTLDAVQEIPQRYFDSAKLLHCSSRQVLCTIVCPAALPGISTGLLIGLGRAWMIIAAAEMLPGSEAGLGYLVHHAFSLAEMDILVAGMLLAGVTGGALHFAMRQLLHRFTFWKRQEVTP